jgi:hypothetical protein
MNPTNNTDLVSPATTESWPYSPHSDVDWEEKTPYRKNDQDVHPSKVVTNVSTINPSGKKFRLPDTDDEDNIDLVDVARQIEQSKMQKRAYEEEERLRKEVEIAAQEARAAAEEARVAEEERELQIAEEQELEEARVAEEEQEIQIAEEQELELLKEANKKKSRKPRQKKDSTTKKKATKSTKKSAPKASGDNDEEAKKTRGKTFTPTDNLIICKAYIATSENSIKGNKTGSADFCDKLEHNFRVLYQTHIDEELRKWNQLRRASDCSSRSNSNTAIPKMPPTTFCERDGKGIWRQFNKVGNECTKFYSAEGQITTTSGENAELARQRHLEVFKARNEGKEFVLFDCAEYLREKPKWRSVVAKNEKKKKDEDGTVVKAERPVGKKRATKEKERRDLVESIAKSAITEVIEEKLNAAKKLKTDRADEMMNADDSSLFAERKLFMAEASAGLKFLMREATMEKMMAKANTPDKMDWQKKQAAIAISEMEARSQQAILEMEKNKLQTQLDIAKLKM